MTNHKARYKLFANMQNVKLEAVCGSRIEKTTQAVEALTRSWWTKLRPKTKRSNPERFVVAFNLWIQSMKQNCSWFFFLRLLFFSPFFLGTHTAPAAVLYMLWASTEEWEASNMAANTCQQKNSNKHLGHQKRQSRDRKNFVKNFLNRSFKVTWYVEENHVQSLLTIHSLA